MYNKKTIMATLLVYSVARGVVDEVRPSEGDESAATDATVFGESIKAIRNKARELEVSNGK